jgi:hypothetical protein
MIGNPVSETNIQSESRRLGPGRFLMATWVAWFGVAVHIATCVGLLLASGGTEAEPVMARRAEWVGQHATAWTALWVGWMFASTSLLGLFVVWGIHLVRIGGNRAAIVVGCALCAIGLACDLTGELVNIGLTRPGISIAEFARSARTYVLLGAAAANGLYCVGGLIMSAISWRRGFQRDWSGLLGFVMWTIGIGLTIAALLDHRASMIATGAGVMITFIPWAAVTGWRFAYPLPPGDEPSPAW